MHSSSADIILHSELLRMKDFDSIWEKSIISLTKYIIRFVQSIAI